MAEEAKASDKRAEELGRKNRRTGLRVAALALFFFVVLFAKRLWLS